MHICDYGCGREAKYPPRKGMKGWCCSKSQNSCPSIRKKNSIKVKEAHKDPNSIYNSTAYKEKQNNAKIGLKRSKESCKNISLGRKGKKNSPPIFVKNCSFDCGWGCGQKAKYYFPIVKKYGCSDHHMKCPINKKIMSEKLEGHIISKKTKEKISKKIIRLNIENEEYRFKQSDSRKYKLKDYKQVYPFFSKIEEMRYNPDKPDEKEIQVHCKNHECENSKEKDGWFTPSGIQLYERIRQLENKNGNGGSYLYCSQHCKDTCILYNLHGDPFKENNLPYTYAEYLTCRAVVFERENTLCEYCGEPATDMHHIFSVKLEPFFALDPDYCIACCEKHHYKYAHKDECSTGNLAKIVCSVESQKFLNQ